MGFLVSFQFEKPGRRENFDYPDMALEAMTKALNDSKIDYHEIQQAAVGYVYGGSIAYSVLNLRDTFEASFQFQSAQSKLVRSQCRRLNLWSEGIVPMRVNRHPHLQRQQ